jgi:arylsulfatase A-like enzyme
MKKIISSTILGSLLLSLMAHAADKPLNIINMVVDDMGYSDLGCMGGPVETPNLDQLAGSGILFTDYRTYPKCAPTRDAIMTGMDAPPVRTQKDGITLAEALKPAGYGTYFVGKAHGSVVGSMQVALQRGFDRSFGNSAGGNFWDPATRQTYLDGKRWRTDKPFYKTDVHTDFAIKFLKENGAEKPFFLHLAYHAPHFPIHAKQEDINKYLGKFMEGPSALRRKRFARMKAMGVLPEGTALAPDFAEMENAWAQLPQEKKELYDRVMAGYCAMIDCVDQNIGRLLAQLDQMGVRENTVIFFSSDNGGSAEAGEGIWPGHWDSRFGRTYDRNAELGGENSHWQVGQAWAHVSNTPLREWKSISHEGGLSAPFIVNAPAIIQFTGQISRRPVMVMDIMPTILDLADVTYPKAYQGRPLKAMRGVSLKSLFEGSETDLSRPMHFFYKETAAYIEYPWKIVTKDMQDFELYHLGKDRTELNNLAAQMPEKLSTLKTAMQDYRGVPLKDKKGKKNRK